MEKKLGKCRLNCWQKENWPDTYCSQHHLKTPNPYSTISKPFYFSLPYCLVVPFLTLRWLASKSIQPILDITRKAEIITKDNLNERLPTLKYKDEINSLSVSINHLLERVEKGVLREKQFTSDASHELRTPLAILKGNFEVLIRKPRTPEEYIAKIREGIIIIDS